VEQEVDGAGEAQLGELLGDLRADALQRLDFGEQGVEELGPHIALLLGWPPARNAQCSLTTWRHARRPDTTSACTGARIIVAPGSGPDDRRLLRRARASWDAEQRAWFEALLEEQDVDIMAWAIGTQKVPERFEGEMMTPCSASTICRSTGERPPAHPEGGRAADAGERAGGLPAVACRRPRALHGRGRRW
jgi:hypothetical protein